VQLCFFFFQAEDGIRDWSVTGVQTCALPIFLDLLLEDGGDFRGADFHYPVPFMASCSLCNLVRSELSTMRLPTLTTRPPIRPARSEERRVGKSGDLGGGRTIRKKKEKNR